MLPNLGTAGSQSEELLVSKRWNQSFPILGAHVPSSWNQRFPNMVYNPCFPISQPRVPSWRNWFPVYLQELYTFSRVGSYVSQLDMGFMSRNCDPNASAKPGGYWTGMHKTSKSRRIWTDMQKCLKGALLFCYMVQYQNVFAQKKFLLHRSKWNDLRWYRQQQQLSLLNIYVVAAVHTAAKILFPKLKKRQVKPWTNWFPAGTDFIPITWQRWSLKMLTVHNWVSCPTKPFAMQW
jgi:hypothetical protein